MMKFFIFVFFALLIRISAYSETADTILNSDTLANRAIEEKYDYLPLTKSPTGAVFRSLAFPGWGQIYVENYWKSSIFIGAAGVLWYRIINNHINYKDFRKELDKIENQSSFEYSVTQGRMITALDDRDLSALYLLGVYILSMVDAYSGAHLLDFKINSNLSYYITPDFDFSGNPHIKFNLIYKLGK